jgi:NADPH2:quinone reductase
VPPGASDIPGLEVAGTIEAGDAQALQAAGFRIGDRVCALVSGGGYAERCVAPVGQCLPVPKGLSDIEAASLPETFFTVWSNVFDRGRLQPGETLLVQGGTSGIGVTAIQLAKAAGARVIATAGSAAKIERAKALGADVAIDYTTTDFAAACRAETGKRGVDAVIEHVGGEVFAASIKAVRSGGRIVTCGATAGFHPAIDLRHIFFRQIEVLGSTMGSKADLLAVLGHVAAGRLAPVVDRVLPLHAAAEGHRALERREAFGRVVLEPAAP